MSLPVQSHILKSQVAPSVISSLWLLHYISRDIRAQLSYFLDFVSLANCPSLEGRLCRHRVPCSHPGNFLTLQRRKGSRPKHGFPCHLLQLYPLQEATLSAAFARVLQLYTPQGAPLHAAGSSSSCFPASSALHMENHVRITRHWKDVLRAGQRQTHRGHTATARFIESSSPNIDQKAHVVNPRWSS